jgi:RNA polymerase sigma-70 factor (ECF subfamily)
LGSGRAKAETFLRHLQPLQGPLEAYCRRSLWDRNATADVLQSAVANAFRDFHLYAEGSNFRAWMFQYAHLEVLNSNRKHRRDRHKELPADLSVEETWQPARDEALSRVLLEDPDPLLDRCDEALAAALRGLTAIERSVFLLRAVGDFTYREIAEIVAIPLGTVMSSLSRARLRLREKLVRYGEENGLLRRERP